MKVGASIYQTPDLKKNLDWGGFPGNQKKPVDTPLYTFCFLGKFDILSPDEIESLAEKNFTLYQDDIEHRFSNELLQFVDYSNEFLDYAEYTIMTFFIS